MSDHNNLEQEGNKISFKMSFTFSGIAECLGMKQSKSSRRGKLQFFFGLADRWPYNQGGLWARGGLQSPFYGIGKNKSALIMLWVINHVLQGRDIRPQKNYTGKHDPKIQWNSMISRILRIPIDWFISNIIRHWISIWYYVPHTIHCIIG